MIRHTICGAIAVLMFCSFLATAQTREEIERKGFKLIILNYDSTLDASVTRQFTETFFIVYPKLAKAYNKKTTRQVTFLIDTAYAGVAEAANGVVRFSAKWFHYNPKDIDVVTHEVMHLVQNYTFDATPGWITEGIADYVRYTYGVSNAEGGWSLPPYNANQNYTNAYRITARFFVWMEKHEKDGIVKTLDSALRAGTFSDDLWKQQTGKTIDELWEAYTQNPII